MVNTIIDISCLIAAGATGGLLYGLTDYQQLSIRWPGRSTPIPVGCAGDMLIGCCGSIGVFILAGNLLNIAWEWVPERTGETLKVLALGIVAGFAGLTLLHQLRQSVLSSTAIRSEIAGLKRSDEAQRFSEEGLHFYFEQQYRLALDAFSRSLAREPDAVDVLLRQAMTLKRLDKTADALTVVERVVKLVPKNARAWYNRACYRCLVDPADEEAIVADLRCAVQLNPEYRGIAAKDADFESIRSTSGFREVVDAGG